MNRTRSLAAVAIFAAVTLSASPQTAQTAQTAPVQLKVVAATPLEKGITEIVEQYKKDTGNDVKLQIANTGQFNQIISASSPETLDVLIGTTQLVDQFISTGKGEGPKTLVGRVGIGVVIRKDASVPNVATSDAIKQAVLAADGVVYNTAGSGQAVQRIFDQWGITDKVMPKATRPGNAAQTMDRLATGKGNEIGFGLLSEVKPYEEKGIKLVGKLPADIQSYTNYEAAIVAGSKTSAVSKAFIQYLGTAASKQKFAATGVD
jgi:molybdate transport system substrate-binding protein